MNAVTLQIPNSLKFTDDEFVEIVAANKDLRLELSHQGELIVMSPTGGETGNRNFELCLDLGYWNRKNGLGKAFDSSTGFKLPNGATRSPDVSWVKIEIWNALTPEQRKKFLPLCPDFVIELVSESDDLADTQAKMREFIANGLRLGWLINPKTKQVEIYRQNQEMEVLQSPTNLSGEDVLPGFILDLQPIFL
ncbi:Uma2 family endonuclease [Dolichospermum sp. ST_con]|nr:Uma2 family endonuclease [Dolichospermum sp. ST_con]MDD1420069.1 Uma2 family endonuclease [Dolichospermum sp. ST_sed1]MDD1427147.1 Uma2 family endonuclease [Dolichospermum sp. ST_sed9]MDD1433512.1 Uma2 family endonuclease [Dolichospermum sp. ST_sed6]MDD1437374.1 Uma2 family endonuclease [Dolichospermum sp. ST_sed10]MDD1441853.1 Uma2 family endonuclease [Dolichospermum sp. ST_sed3]MDD1446620.1 Uma2 family endonuclease [Dolichospermum sp. ST_sed8]MDD1456573.1 Uma2 family endonuclease [Dolic